MAMTYVDALNVAIEAVSDEAVIEKLTALKSQMAKKKGSSKPTKTQRENEEIKDKILAVLADTEEPMRVNEIMGAVEGGYTSQKISALCRQLVEAGKVNKIVDKKVSRFELA